MVRYLVHGGYSRGKSFDGPGRFEARPKPRWIDWRLLQFSLIDRGTMLESFALAARRRGRCDIWKCG